MQVQLNGYEMPEMQRNMGHYTTTKSAKDRDAVSQRNSVTVPQDLELGLELESSSYSRTSELRFVKTIVHYE